MDVFKTSQNQRRVGNRIIVELDPNISTHIFSSRKHAYMLFFSLRSYGKSRKEILRQRDLETKKLKEKEKKKKENVDE
jgi:hypothetical protein